MFPGWILFFLITLPWHIAMFQIHGNLFYREYIFKHHIERFIDSKEIGRKEPFYYLFIVFAVGFIHWSFSFVAMIMEKFNSLI
jgi:4-amino-4-deoxy-L-arabinose transferase-like glycosyltransferase